MQTEQRVNRRYLGAEVVTVLLVSFGMSGIYALLSLIRAELTIKGGIAGATATVVASPHTQHPWLDFADALADVLNGIAPAFLALVLLWRSPGGPGIGIGLDRRRPGRDVLQALGFAALIGIPGLGLVYAAHVLGLNASLEVTNVPDVWYRLPLLVLHAVESGTAEEVVVLAFLLTRFAQMGWRRETALITQATIRGSYHLYQGFGGFIGNFVMGLIFGWWFQRSRRVWPLLGAHVLLDTASFVGYTYLHPYIHWI